MKVLTGTLLIGVIICAVGSASARVAPIRGGPVLPPGRPIGVTPKPVEPIVGGPVLPPRRPIACPSWGCGPAPIFSTGSTQ